MQTTEVSLTIIIYTNIWQKKKKTSPFFHKRFELKWQAFFLHSFDQCFIQILLEDLLDGSWFYALLCSTTQDLTGLSTTISPHKSKAVIWILEQKLAYKQECGVENKHLKIMIYQERIFQIFWTGHTKMEAKHRSLLYGTGWLNNQERLRLALNCAN